jgi:hypothetical protein
MLACDALSRSLSRDRVHRTLESFTHTTPVIIAESDASLSGAGLIWSVRNDGAEDVLGVSAVDLTRLGFGVDSSYQNVSKFIGAVLSVIGQVVLGFSRASLALRGGSVTALTWAITERPRGAMVWTLLCIAADINVKEIKHIAGEDNEKCDRLSRRGASPETSILADAADMGMSGAQVLEMNGDETIMGIIELCDPRVQLDSELQFIDFWTSARVAIEKFMAVHGPVNEEGARPASALQSSSNITPQRDRRKNNKTLPVSVIYTTHVLEKAIEERKSSEDDKEEGPELVRKVPTQPVRKVPIPAAVSSVKDTSCPAAGEAVKHAVTGGSLSAESRQELSTFTSKSVLPQTTQVYNKNFAAWQEFIKIETGSDDPFLTGFSDNVSLMMLRRHQSGKRGKAATAFTAAI